ncbi:hypothetical protein TNCV_2834711, partial [Trichonephila clavipes]
APSKSGLCFHNYKGTFVIVLVDFGTEGHNSDGGVFKNSVFGQALKEKL